jgi:hypothetical protein
MLFIALPIVVYGQTGSALQQPSDPAAIIPTASPALAAMANAPKMRPRSPSRTACCRRLMSPVSPTAGVLGLMTLLNAQGLLYLGAGALAMARLDADPQRCYTWYLRVALGAWQTGPIRALRRGSASPEDPR